MLEDPAASELVAVTLFTTVEEAMLIKARSKARLEWNCLELEREKIFGNQGLPIVDIGSQA